MKEKANKARVLHTGVGVGFVSKASKKIERLWTSITCFGNWHPKSPLLSSENKFELFLFLQSAEARCPWSN